MKDYTGIGCYDWLYKIRKLHPSSARMCRMLSQPNQKLFKPLVPTDVPFSWNEAAEDLMEDSLEYIRTRKTNRSRYIGIGCQKLF